jgi:hypothetical protein
MPINWKSKVILAKIETTYGVDAAPTGALNAILMTNVSFSPMEGEDVSRDLELPYLAAQPMIPVGLRGRLKGRVELVPSGSLGAAPGWGPMLRGCAVAQTVNAGVSVVYNPISTAMESLTLYFWIGGTRHVLTGCRGDAVLSVKAQGLPYFDFDMVGLWSIPTETAPAVPTLTGFQTPVVATKANTPVFTINAVAMVMRDAVLSLNNQVEPRLLIGSESIIIPDRADAFKCRVEAVPVSTFNPYALANAQTQVAAALTHGTTAGKIAALAIPRLQLKRLSGFENAQNILEWPLEGVPLANAGNDQWSLTLT